MNFVSHACVTQCIAIVGETVVRVSVLFEPRVPVSYPGTTVVNALPVITGGPFAKLSAMGPPTCGVNVNACVTRGYNAGCRKVTL